MPIKHKSFKHFIQNSIVDFPTQCWTYRACPEKDGYCRIGMNGKRYSIHRASYSYFKGQIPYGKEIDHLCRNRKCFNPSHLEAITHRTNVLRGIGLSAINAKKTFCPKGHLYIGYNIKMTRNQERICRTCAQDQNRIFMREYIKNPDVKAHLKRYKHEYYLRNKYAN